MIWEGIKKPNLKIFEKALSELAVSANESIFVGDHPENDIKATMNVGMLGIWKKDIHWDDVKANYKIDGLKELLFIIDKFNKKLI